MVRCARLRTRSQDTTKGETGHREVAPRGDGRTRPSDFRTSHNIGYPRQLECDRLCYCSRIRPTRTGHSSK